MANPEHLEILKQGVEGWNTWVDENPGIRADLRHANLAETNLRGVNFSGANLTAADLVRSNLSHADLSSADLSGSNLADANLASSELLRVILTNANLLRANLSNASLREGNLIDTNLTQANLSKSGLGLTNLIRTSLRGADLEGAYLFNAHITEANLTGADLSYAHTGWTTFSNIDLSEVIGLNAVEHFGPSSIGMDTIYKSRGKIPMEFLRGCGLTDDFFTFLPSLIGAQQAIEFYSCFISYSTKDESFARRLYSRMRDEKLRVWFAPEDLQGGKKVHDQLERAIQLHDRLLIILSEQSMKSEWVTTELRKARKQEIRENRRKLFPIRLVSFDAIRQWECFDSDSGKDLAVELREYFIPDFSNWKDQDSFESSFGRLLKDLRAAEER